MQGTARKYWNVNIGNTTRKVKNVILLIHLMGPSLTKAILLDTETVLFGTANNHYLIFVLEETKEQICGLIKGQNGITRKRRILLMNFIILT